MKSSFAPVYHKKSSKGKPSEARVKKLLEKKKKKKLSKKTGIP